MDHTLGRGVRFTATAPAGTFRHQHKRVGDRRSRRRSGDYDPLCKRDGVKLYVDLSLGNFHDVYDEIAPGAAARRGREPANGSPDSELLPTGLASRWTAGLSCESHARFVLALDSFPAAVCQLGL